MQRLPFNTQTREAMFLSAVYLSMRSCTFTLRIIRSARKPGQIAPSTTYVKGCCHGTDVAEGLGIRSTARVCEVNPDTVLGWLVEVADQLQTFSMDFLHDVHLTQVQWDALYALLGDVKSGAFGTAEAIERLDRSPH